MLKVITSKEAGIVNTDMSSYTPFIAEFENEKSSTPIYWRVGNFDTSLIEIGINKSSGCVSGLSLLMFNAITNLPSDEKVELDVEIGTPVFDIRGWPEDGCLDTQYNFKVFRSEGSLRLVFSNKLKPIMIYRNEIVDFCVGESGVLIWIDFSNLDKGALSDLG